MDSGKPQKQALAIAYAAKRHAKKMSKGGSVDDRNPMLRAAGKGDAPATASLDHLHEDSRKQNHDEPMETPAEPARSVSPDEVNMGRNNPIGERIERALNMAMGGRVDEHDGMHSADSDIESGGENLPHGEDENRALAMNDTYPPGKAESDTQAQDEGFGESRSDSQQSDSDQEEQRSRMRRALGRW